MQPYTAQADDIEAVLTRFQAWTGNKPGARSKGNADDGIREISYEEALRSSRYRWKARTNEQAANEQAETEPQAAQPLEAAPGVIPIAAPERAPEPQPASATPGYEPAPAVDLRKARAAAPSNDFRAMLKQTVLEQTVSTGETALVRARTGEAKTGEHDRQVSMSLRLAASEQALIKLRAAEAGVSASAYLRQCALEVEHLRAQMRILLEVAQTASRPNPQSQERQPRFIDKLRMLFLREKKKPVYAETKSSAGWLHRRELAG